MARDIKAGRVERERCINRVMEKGRHTQRTRDTQRAMWDGILVENARESGNTNIKTIQAKIRIKE